MFKPKEIGHLIIAIILFAFIISFLNIFEKGIDVFLPALLIAFIVIAVNVVAKKLLSFFLEVEIEQKILHWQRWGWYERSYFKRPIPVGIILPFLLVWISYPTGFIKMLTFLQFEPKPTSARVAKRHGLYRYAELTEWHIAAIAGMGIFINLALAVIAYLLNYPELAKFSIYYSAWNILPLGQLDGSKLLFGSRRLWAFLVILTLIGLFYTLVLGYFM